MGELGAFHEAFRAEFATPLPATVLDELRWYFEQCRQAENRARLPSDARFRSIQQAFDVPVTRARTSVG
jgi:hypothetical protein